MLGHDYGPRFTIENCIIKDWQLKFSPLSFEVWAAQINRDDEIFAWQKILSITADRMIPFLSDHIDSVDPDMTSLDSFLGDFSAPKTFVLIYYPRKFVMDQSALEFLFLFWFLLRIWQDIF